MAASLKPLRSGELARLTRVSPDTLRHYEKLGILPTSPRTESGYRMYSASAIDRVRLVQQALQLGFTLTELSEILRTRDTGGAPWPRVLRLAQEKLAALNDQISQLRRTERYLRRLIRDWRSRLSHTAPGEKALLLHSLSRNPPSRGRSASNLKRRHQP